MGQVGWLTFEELQVYHMLIADNTAKMNASLFDCYGELLQPGDIVRLTGGYCSLYKVLALEPVAQPD